MRRATAGMRSAPAAAVSLQSRAGATSRCALVVWERMSLPLLKRVASAGRMANSSVRPRVISFQAIAMIARTERVILLRASAIALLVTNTSRALHTVAEVSAR